ncbi:MAG: hypothetical protein KDB79_02175 [Acidobacteria bacterium]|nr:hypothetical protein [Acidobacteriota bacterium]
MRRILYGLLFCFMLAGGSFGQVRGRPEPTPLSPVDQSIERANEIGRRSNELRNVEAFPVKNDTERKVFKDQIEPLYRKPTDDEMLILSPDPEVVEANGAFLKQKKTGIIKLVIDNDCASDKNIVKATPECAKYTMPGAGSAYSFREEMHRLIRLADLNFRKNTFQALGTLTHGIMTELGDVPIESVDLKSPDSKFIVDFKPAKDINAAAKIAGDLTKGIKNKGRTYASVLPVKLNSTYLLRSIAYRGEAAKVAGPIVYNELDFDNRRDMIVAFRVVKFVPNESVVILWKELDDNKSPKIKTN